MDKIKIEIKWALIFSLMTLAWIFIERIAGLHSENINLHPYLTNIFAVPAIIVMVLALKDKKKNFYNGSMTYMQGLISGVILSTFIAILSPLTQWLIANVISPDFFKNMIDFTLDLGYYKTQAEAEAYFNYENYAKQSAIGAFVMGVITTAVAMILLQTKNKTKHV
ncbi:DUF4199 domain-containing protein [Weeksellaceae bacterium KMM 9713]|uniref:DUF4199 domain-containing protein n=1 Tax=Profundicola chukchiensis TaxID=2961959 RepID=A0A9X4MYH3_9FLAO|nr:DUF4199 domain-containing protein [Profundicola chukchiensis]MDG4946443.1 DUF4199 domain-containing protein [Profundicola chukchiensis]